MRTGDTVQLQQDGSAVFERGGFRPEVGRLGLELTGLRVRVFRHGAHQVEAGEGVGHGTTAEIRNVPITKPAAANAARRMK